MLDPHVTRFPPTPLRTIVLSAYRKTGPASLARRASDDVSERHAEQWDEFRCAAGCGAFEYRHRTRRLRRQPT